MKKNIEHTDLPWLIETYFSNPAQQIQVKQGDVLMEQGGLNNRLYLVLEGTLAAYVKKPDQGLLKLFIAQKNMFVGVYSFFSRTYQSSATVVAEEDCQVAFIDQSQEVKCRQRGLCLFEQFMPIAVTDLAQRQQREQQNAFLKEKALKKLIHTEKLASLGQMAAGIAHELNNAIAVLERNTQWLQDTLTRFWKKSRANEYQYFQQGLEEGRKLSSREVRKRTKLISKKFSVSANHARKLAEADLSESQLAGAAKNLVHLADKINIFWEVGATFHDMIIAARHASHVVRSVRDLSAYESNPEQQVDVNETIRQALALLRSPLRAVTVETDLQPLPEIQANKGALVQVWTNLMRNAIESMTMAGTASPRLIIKSQPNTDFIVIEIQDNGPGIPKKIQTKIIQPNFSTKEKGLEFGLGLGLTIVSRIIVNHQGDISVESRSGKTQFTVQLPLVMIQD